MERYQLTLSYDGTEYKGFQRQGKTRTVQLEIERVLKDLGWHGKSILFSGRTDSGVHALGQVIAFDLEWNHAEIDLLNAFNAKLPADIAVLSCRNVKNDFHPRFDAKNRVYLYSILISKHRQPLKERYAWRIPESLDMELLNLAAGVVVGTHDFKCVGRAMKEDGTTIRTVYHAHWTRGPDKSLRFEICANAFLYHMVRRIVFIHTSIARSWMSIDQFRDMIDAKHPGKPGIAPPCGLCLMKCNYG